MAKGYWIAQVDVSDMDGYRANYVAALPAVFKAYGGQYVTRGGQFEVVEGASKPRVVVIEFPSYQAAVDCYRSPAYSAIKAKRMATATADLTIVEGYDGP